MSEPMDHLDDLFARYRHACPDPEASAAFTPGLWQKIDARRNFAWKLGFYAKGLASVAAALCLAVAIFQLSPFAANPVYTQTYLEALRSANPPETLAYAYSELIGADEPVQDSDIQ